MAVINNKLIFLTTTFLLKIYVIAKNNEIGKTETKKTIV